MVLFLLLQKTLFFFFFFYQDKYFVIGQTQLTGEMLRSLELFSPSCVLLPSHTSLSCTSGLSLSYLFYLALFVNTSVFKTIKKGGSLQLTNSPPVSFRVFPVWAKIVIDTVVFLLRYAFKTTYLSKVSAISQKAICSHGAVTCNRGFWGTRFGNHSFVCISPLLLFGRILYRTRFLLSSYFTFLLVFLSCFCVFVFFIYVGPPPPPPPPPVNR